MRSMLSCMGLGIVLVISGACSDDESPSTATRPPETRTEPENEMPAETSEAGDASAPASSPPPSTSPAAEVDWSSGDPQKGEQVYGTYCQTCHGETGAGDGPGAAAIEPKPRDFRQGNFQFDANDNGEPGEPADLARVIREGAAVFGGSPNMVAWGTALSTEDVQNVVAYVGTLANPE